MADGRLVKTNGEAIWFDSDFFNSLTSEAFEADYWHKKNALTGSAEGRGTAFFFAHGDHQFVLRHYKRGGLVSKLIADQYLYTGLQNTRAWQERDLLLTLQTLDLPAPRPVAARVTRSGLTYQADLITLKIPNAVDVHSILQKHPVPEGVWFNIGRTIKAFHQQQVYHHDLNIHNIMLDHEQKVWLIDFDKCAVKSGDSWKKDNLDRLLRSINKERNKLGGYHAQNSDWPILLQGYQEK